MSVIPLHLIENTPGFAGKLCKWILSTSMYKQPQLALAAALAATGTLKGHKIASETNLRTNHLIVGVGLPSCGKGHALKCVQKLFVEIGAEHRLAGKPVSDTSLLSALVAGGGVKLTLWDEFGLGLSKITHPKAPIYKSNILNVMMQLFSSADTIYRGDEYANRDGKNPRVDILEPCLNVYGVSTPVRFHEALNGDFGSDGFLSRLLIFDSGNIHPEPEMRPEPYYLPDELINHARSILEEVQPIGENDLEPHPVPREVKYSAGAVVTVYRLVQDFADKRKGEKSETIQSIYGRAVEHIIKIALTVEPTRELTLNTLHWAEELYNYLSSTLIELIGNDISSSESEKHLRKVLSHMNGKPISQAELTRLIQALSPRERKEAIQTLVDSERIEVFKQIIEGSQRPTTFYRKIS